MLDQLKRLVQSLSIRQRIQIVAAVLAAIGAIWSLAYWNKERDFKQLFAGLAADDAGAIVAKLRETGTEFRIQQNGGEVLVPSARVAELRLQMAAGGLPKSGRIGYEIFDKTNFGQTDFAEQVNYRRALEGELERSIISMQEIETARVHIAFAKDSMFTDTKQPAKASVLVKLKPGVTLAPPNVDAISHLVSSAVESLQPGQVAVVDSKGKVLPGTPQHTGDSDASDWMLDYKKQLEQNVLDKVIATLAPLLGAERFRAGVTAECDFTSGDQSEETLDPSKSVMVTSQRSEDSGTSSSLGGVPGTQSNLPRPAARPASGGGLLNRRTENVQFQTSRLVKHLKLPRGTVKRLSVSVLVDQHVRWDVVKGKANKTVEPPTAAQLKSVRDVVSGIVGLDASRGDQLVVETMPFENTLAAEPPADLIPRPPGSKTSTEQTGPIWKQQKYQAIAGGALAGILLLGVMVLLLKKKKPKTGHVEVDAKTGIEGGGEKTQDRAKQIESKEEADPEKQAADALAQEEARAREVLGQIKLPDITTKKGEVLTRHIREEVKKAPDSIAYVVRTWLNASEE